MGALDLIRFNVWTLTSADPEVLVALEGQFQPEDGAEYGSAPNLSDSATAGSDRPTVQWVHGGSRRISIRSAFYSLNMLDDIRSKLDALEALDAKDPTLGRAPRVTFAWGDLTITGFATVKKRIPGWWAVSGWPRAVIFDLEIVEAPALDFTGSGSVSGSGETQFVTLGAGESLELLALRFYGDPLLGELIRRENPDLAEGETAGDRVKVLEREHPRARGPVVPTAPSFLDRKRRGDTWAPLVEDLAATRGVELAGLPWDRLPDVVAGLVVVPSVLET
jgi:hypothetical protein